MASSTNSPAGSSGTSTLGRVLAFVATSLLAGLVVTGLVFPPAAAVGMAANGSIGWFKDLPTDFSDGPLSRSSTVYARDGETVLATFFAENRTPVTLDEISPNMQDAILSIEDRDFYDHGGVSVGGIVRALGNNLLGDGGRQGASTITQQYVNNLIIDQDVRAGRDPSTLGANKGYADKLREVKLAMSMEEQKSKDEILEGYLNIALFGPRNYGVEAASEFYWGIPASELSIAQAATLAGLVQSPAYYDPASNPEVSVERRNVVLYTMLDEGRISQQEYDDALAEPLNLDLHPKEAGCTASTEAPYFCDYVENQILASDTFGANPEDRMNTLQRGGLEIVTTLDMDAQEEANDAVNDTQSRDSNPQNIGSSMVSVEPGSGNIVAMAQNTHYTSEEGDSNTVYNFNTDTWDGGTGGYQVGSTFKPVTLLAWVDSGRSVGEQVDARRMSYPANFPWQASCVDGGSVFEPGNDGNGFSFQNASSGYNRQMAVDYGMYNSINSALYAMASQLDLCRIGELAESIGIHNGQTGEAVNTTQLSALLGGSNDNISPMTMATAYSTFANDGVRCEPRAFISARDHTGRDYEVPEPDCERAISEDDARTVNYVLEQVIVRGSGYQLGIGLPNASAGKTGTTDNSTQTWMVGYTHGLATASWVGNYLEGSRSLNDLSIGGNPPASQTSDPDDFVDGSTYAGGQWQRFMRSVAPNYDTEAFPDPPSNLTQGSGATPNPNSGSNNGGNGNNNGGNNAGGNTGGNNNGGGDNAGGDD
ncbi:penicillin-binding protein [Kocuria coralli]|uniref:Penicillin-binding protein n=1 Tax=Kocuria coralli TaxID=1461025 RepID=A0A5J5L2U0_9MICC|nr:transglycosylase domain-containing protein [Kocuria coralli]KAA9395321.1 penicillin-binding protein [Kocuria coralli]